MREEVGIFMSESPDLLKVKKEKNAVFRFFVFDLLIVGKFLKLVYWIGNIFVIGLTALAFNKIKYVLEIVGLRLRRSEEVYLWFIVFGCVLVLLIVWRVVCEQLIVSFNLAEKLQSLDKKKGV